MSKLWGRRTDGWLIRVRRAIRDRVGRCVINRSAAAGVEVIKPAITGSENGAFDDGRALDVLAACVAGSIDLGDGRGRRNNDFCRAAQYGGLGSRLRLLSGELGLEFLALAFTEREFGH